MLFAGPLLLSPVARATDTYWAPVALAIALILLRSRVEHSRADGAYTPPAWLRHASGVLYVSVIAVIVACQFGLGYVDQLATLFIVWVSTLLGCWKSLEPPKPVGQLAVGLILPLLGGVALLTGMMRYAQGAMSLAVAIFSVGVFALRLGFSLTNETVTKSSTSTFWLGVSMFAVGAIQASDRATIQDLSTVLCGVALIVAAAGARHESSWPLVISGAITSLALVANMVGAIKDAWLLSAASAAAAVVAMLCILLSVRTLSSTPQRLGLGLGALAIALAGVSMIQSGQRVFATIAFLSAAALFFASLSNFSRMARVLSRLASRPSRATQRLRLSLVARRLRRLAQRDTNLGRLGVLHLAVLVASTYLTVVWALYK